MSTHGWHWVSCLNKRPSWRTNEDIDIILSKLKTMKVFEHYPEAVLLELSRFALYDTFLANVTLYRPGEEGLYWYAVIAGNLEMLDVDHSDSSKTTTICNLRDGDSFGENVIFGTTRQTMIVTTEYCELLFVEAANIRQIYESHKEAMQGLLTASTMSHDTSETTDSGDRDSLASTDSDLTMAGVTLHQLIRDHFSELISDHRVNLFTYRQCSSGRKMVDFVMTQSSAPRTRPQVIQMWQALLTEGVIEHVNNEHPFRDDPQLFYRFKEQKACVSESRSSRRWSFFTRGFRGSHATLDEDGPLANGRPRSLSSVTSSPRSSRSSLSSILDECFDTIAALGPETLIYATLRKEPADRQAEEVELIYEELLHVRAFRHLSNAVKKELATCARLEHYKRAGKYVFRQGDKGDSWYVILRGSVSVVITGKGVVCTLHEGDEFGKLALLNEAGRSSSIQVREDNSYFIRIERTDFRRILLSVESTNIKLVEHGKEVLLLEKASLGKYLVVKGTPEKMLDHLLESEVEAGSQEDSFARDFFLTYPAFISITDLCEGLRTRYTGSKDKGPVDETSLRADETDKVKKRRVSSAVSIWINTGKAEIVKDTVFLQLLKDIQDGLAKDSLTEELSVLTSSLAESIRSASVGAGSGGHANLHAFSKSRKQSSIQEHEIKLGISTIPAHSPQDKVPLRVHTKDRTLCRLQVRLDTTARSIVEESCQKLELRPSSDYELCEVKSSGEKVRLKDKDISVYSETSVNGRLFVMPKKHSEQDVPPLPDQNQIPVSPFPDKDSSREVAAHLTAYDWNLFANIQQMEYIYQLFGRHKFGKIVTNLDLLIRRFNEVQYWVVTEICREPDLVKRVTLVKKFIKIAGYCKNFNNLNSFFAITIGLMNGAISRLHHTWKEVPPRQRTRFEQFQALTDPSRNHKVLRAYQSKVSPPMIPFMPLVTKDAYFLNIGNETFIDGLVNFEKMRLVANSVRRLNRCRSGNMASDVKVLSNKNPALQQYIRNLRVVDNEVVLTKMSHKVEPSDSRTPVASSS